MIPQAVRDTGRLLKRCFISAAGRVCFRAVHREPPRRYPASLSDDLS